MAKLIVPLIVVVVGASACLTPRADRPTTPVARGDHAGVRFEKTSTTITAIGFDVDPTAESYVVDALNHAADGGASDTPVKTAVTLAPEGAGAPAFGSGQWEATLVTQAEGGPVTTTTERGAVGSQTLGIAGLVGMGIGSVAVSVSTALFPLNVGLAPVLGVTGCGVLALGCGLTASMINTQMTQKDGSDLLVRAIAKHGTDLAATRKTARAEVPPPTPTPATSATPTSATPTTPTVPTTTPPTPTTRAATTATPTTPTVPTTTTTPATPTSTTPRATTTAAKSTAAKSAGAKSTTTKSTTTTPPTTTLPAQSPTTTPAQTAKPSATATPGEEHVVLVIAAPADVVAHAQARLSECVLTKGVVGVVRVSRGAMDVSTTDRCVARVLTAALKGVTFAEDEPFEIVVR